MTKVSIVVGMALSLTGLLPLSAVASSGGYNQAVSDYNAGKYGIALSEFEACQSSYPNNAMVHYYRALCLQSLGRLEKAKDEFRWVGDHGDARLKSMAQSGLNQLSRAHTQGGHGASLNSSNIVATSSASQSKGKVKKVLEFYADWCGPCKAFAPVFEEVKGHMRDISFERYNVDDESSQPLRAKYQFQSIPRIVLLDGSDNLLFNGSPERDVESFERQILQFR